MGAPEGSTACPRRRTPRAPPSPALGSRRRRLDAEVDDAEDELPSIPRGHETGRGATKMEHVDARRDRDRAGQSTAGVIDAEPGREHGPIDRQVPLVGGDERHVERYPPWAAGAVDEPPDAGRRAPAER